MTLRAVGRTAAAILIAVCMTTMLGSTPASAHVIPTAAQASTTAQALADGTRVAGGTARTAALLNSGNNGAYVTGVGYCSNINVAGDCWTYVNKTNGTPCPSGHFCIYTNSYAYQGGKVFSFYHCRYGGSDWALHAWYDTGFYHNSNTGWAHAYIKGVSHNVLKNIAPGDADWYNYAPAYYVQAC